MKTWFGILIAFLATAACGDVVHLRDGRTLEGQVRRSADGYQIIAADGKTTVVSAGDVQSIELKKNATPESPDEQYESLERFLAGTSDPKQAVERCNAFIAQNHGTAAAEKAAGELSAWRERADKGMIRVGTRWLTPQQVAQQSVHAKEAVRIIAPLVEKERTAPASAALDKALALAPDDPALLYLKGLVLVQQDQLVAARRTFEQVQKTLPDHAATHNNLAVILWKTHALIPSLAEYDKAMLAEPASRPILDNVAEALHALPENLHKNAVARRVIDHFRQQDAELQEQLRAEGLHRVGAKWITQEEFDKRQASTKSATETKETYRSDVLALQARMLEIDRKIDYDMQILKSLRQQSTEISAYDGQTHEYPLPHRYYELEAEVSALKAERLMKSRQLEQMPKTLREAQQATVSNDYTGQQNLIGVSGTPGLAPTTQPTTRPS